MQHFIKTQQLVATLAALVLLSLAAPAAEARGKVRLFILSGQSNMVGLNPDLSFTPTLRETYPDDEVLVVRDAAGGQPIRRWYKGAQGGNAKPGDLYDRLMTKVRQASAGKKIESVTFVWMQGESDGLGRGGEPDAYARNLAGLIEQLRDDIRRPDTVVVIGRICDHKNTPGWAAVRAAEMKVAEADPLAGWVDTDDLNGPNNGIHYTKPGYAELGRRFAVAAAELLKKKDRAADAPASNAPLRTWTYTTGSTIEARLVAIEKDRVKLQKEDGRILSIAIQRFSEKDREFLKEQAAKGEAENKDEDTNESVDGSCDN